ncbi:hypothetical protein BC939DRAFT_460606 [Gamsiella multidivaricata]|uniref:uncharacterized protein n=1 Tax=Gamsiella multidivaricata TaxID=101098 RepID=UPI00221E74C6|nr:uncharacterized protein BC939DRAFT_460606 [Gamsiella multidivaricata]KAI7819226.1 hypothetical protein BC939DRAFT_460606 [Gamsiella multidivaricata]
MQALGLTCCCWSTYTSTSNSMSRKTGEKEAGADELISGPARGVPMIHAFDVVILQNEMDGTSKISESIAAHTIRCHSGDPTDMAGERLSLCDLSQYIQLASKVKVRLSMECEELLNAYFRVMRGKGSGLDTNELSSISVMSTLLRLATCHAKLCFRSVAVTDDALISIMMMEETIAARFGKIRSNKALWPCHAAGNKLSTIHSCHFFVLCQAPLDWDLCRCWMAKKMLRGCMVHPSFPTLFQETMLTWFLRSIRASTILRRMCPCRTRVSQSVLKRSATS